MLRSLLVLTLSFPAHAETRCGWYHNPTPANVILEDAEGQWWFSRQGSASVPGFEDAYGPAFDDRLRINYAGKVTDRYGYSCACAEGLFDADAPTYEKVLSVSRLTEIPLSRCEQDRALPAP